MYLSFTLICHSKILACAIDVHDRLHWFPPAGKYNSKDAIGKGGIVLLDLKTMNAQRMDLIGFENTFFQPHGLGIVIDPDHPDMLIIAVVNHGLNGSSIEFFSSKIGSLQAQHYQTVKNSELLFAPNDVIPLDRQRFYASNDCSYPKGFMWYLERYLTRPWSFVVYQDENGRLRYFISQ